MDRFGDRLDDRHETLRLACELDARAAEMAIEVGAPEHALLAAGCAGRAASLSETGRAQLIDLLVMLFEADAASRSNTVDNLIRFARTAEQRGRVRQAFDRLLPPKQLAVASADAVLGWDERGPQADALLEAVLDVGSVERSTTQPQDILSRLLAQRRALRARSWARRAASSQATAQWLNGWCRTEYAG